MIKFREAENGTQIDELLEPEQARTKEHGKMLKRVQILEDGSVPAKKIKKLED